MPELPEVEVVRRALDGAVTARTVASVEVLHARAARRQDGDLAALLTDRRLRCASRRGKFLWFPIQDDQQALVVHLGMSGQLLLQPAATVDETHLRVRIRFSGRGPELRFVDQRTFGSVALVPTVDDGAGGRVPAPVAHIARDPLDPDFDEEGFLRRLRTRRTDLKRALLDQTLVSGIGNIYADEALWRTRLHWATPAEQLRPARARELLGAVREVFVEALVAGGTSFDALYVHVNGESGAHSESLAAYGQEGLPCPRCGTPIVREAFMNRSSFRCPRCQRRPAR